MKKKGTKKPKIVVDNKMKGSFGETHFKKNVPVEIRINVKKHKGNKEELADTLKHELMHARHPKMTEKAVYKKTKSVMDSKEKENLLAKLKTRKNYQQRAFKGNLTKYKKNATKEPGSMITRTKTALMGG